jgi:hypothetical protein
MADAAAPSRVKLLTFVEDASPGVHDMLFRSCDRFMYELRSKIQAQE